MTREEIALIAEIRELVRALTELARIAAQGIEARRAIDAVGGVVEDESPVGNADAP